MRGSLRLEIVCLLVVCYALRGQNPKYYDVFSVSLCAVLNAWSSVHDTLNLLCLSSFLCIFCCSLWYKYFLGILPFKVQLFQGCKSETEPINTKSVVQHFTKPIPSIVAVVQLFCQVTLSTSLHTHQLFVYDTKYCWRHIAKRFELNTVCKSFKRCKMDEPCERTLRNRRRNANES
jgi:hypothetical protein